jgi:hypothetical protein
VNISINNGRHVPDSGMTKLFFPKSIIEQMIYGINATNKNPNVLKSNSPFTLNV